MGNLEKEIETLKYHNQLLLNIIKNPKASLDFLYVEKNITLAEAKRVNQICEELNKQYQIEKAEGYMNFQPLLGQLKRELNPKLSLKEFMEACMTQGEFISLMSALSKSQ
ncbi:DUF1878 family protein [Peribacillus sp. B-H-3]|uniref:DUF1878 family protein n=1 Tax=Peribacillus sp. B-H-3 TaxID=3400420 RepID=UPI003B026BCC